MGFSRVALLLLSLVAPAARAAPEPAAQIGAASGRVTVDEKPATVGQSLALDQVLETGEDGKATLLLAKRNVLHVDSNSKLKLTAQNLRAAFEDTELSLVHGRIRALVRRKSGEQRRFQVHTRSAVMGVRGTHVYVDSPANPAAPASFLTLDGTAVVHSDGHPEQAATLQKNQSITDTALNAPGGGVLTPKTLSREAARELADSVAPPPAEVKVESQVTSLQTTGKAGPAAGPPAPDAAGAPAAALPSAPVIPFDPVANSGGKFGPLSIKVKVKSSE